MSYTGSIADDHMVEVAKDGDPAKGSWVVPEASTRDFDRRWFVERDEPGHRLSERRHATRRATSSSGSRAATGSAAPRTTRPRC